MRIAASFLVAVLAGGFGFGVARATEQAAPAAPLKETVNGLTYHMPYGRPTRPFTPAVQAGNLLFLAGRIGTTPASPSAVVPGGIQAETRQTLLNIKDVLEKSGSSMEHVAKCTVFMGDMKEWDAMNEVYATFFPNHKPARSAFGATGLALNAKVEIECIAVAK